MPKPIKDDTTFLPPGVSDLYTIADGVLVYFADSEFGEIDLRKITLDQAVLFEQKGYLVKKPV